MKYVLLMMTFFVMLAGKAQIPYFDVPGAGIRVLENTTAGRARNAALRTGVAYAVAIPTTAIEIASRTRLDPFIIPINYLDYKDVCTYYINPFKKRACQNKYNYLVGAHQQALGLVMAGVTTINNVNQGVKEQIGEKYVHITNVILKELEDMKHHAEKEFFFRRLVLGAK